MKSFIRVSMLALATNFVLSTGAMAANGHLPKAKPAGGLNCNEAAVPGNGKDSPNYQYFKDLYARAQAGQSIDLSEFLKLWYPAHGDGSNMDSPFFACEDQPMGAFMLADPNNSGSPAANCRPDILYSWGPAVKLDILNNLVDGQAWSGPLNSGGQILNGTEFTSISPVTTFGYGDSNPTTGAGGLLFRFKIKKTTPYVFYSFGAPAGEVGVRQDTYHDFGVSDASIVESVSIGTPEIYDEVVRDILHFQSGNRVSAYNIASGTALDRLYNQLVDGHDQSEAHLKANLLMIISEILNGQGVLSYNAGVCRNYQLTFSTAYPAYFEPLQSPTVPAAFGGVPAPAAPAPAQAPAPVQPTVDAQAVQPAPVAAADQDPGVMQPIPNPPEQKAAVAKKAPVKRRVVKKPAAKRPAAKVAAHADAAQEGKKN